MSSHEKKRIAWDDLLIVGGIYKLNAKHKVTSGLYYMYVAPNAREYDNKLISLKTGLAWNLERLRKLPDNFTRFRKNIHINELMI